jgi:hypothetical protein
MSSRRPPGSLGMVFAWLRRKEEGTRGDLSPAQMERVGAPRRWRAPSRLREKVRKRPGTGRKGHDVQQEEKEESKENNDWSFSKRVARIVCILPRSCWYIICAPLKSLYFAN